MESFQTEEQQVEAIKGFWKEYGNLVIGGIILGFSGFIGFNLYKDSKLADEVAVTDSYIELQEAAGKTPEKFAAQAQSFIDNNSETGFASLAALALAKEAVDKQDWQAAQTHLTSAINKAKDEGTKAVATLRLARVQIQAEQIEQALTTLATDLPESFLASVEALKGDAYILQGKKELARAAYQTAIDNQGLAADPNLQMKLDDLAQVTSIAE